MADWTMPKELITIFRDNALVSGVKIGWLIKRCNPGSS